MSLHDQPQQARSVGGKGTQSTELEVMMCVTRDCRPLLLVAGPR
jgi:hypothetical protein